MIFLFETKMKDHMIDGVRRHMGYSHGFHIPSVGRAGGLSLWWLEKLNVNIFFFSKHVIDICICLEDSSFWVRVTFVYRMLYHAENEEF